MVADLRPQDAEVAVGGDGVGDGGAELAQDGAEHQRQRQRWHRPLDQVERAVVAEVPAASAISGVATRTREM